MYSIHTTMTMYACVRCIVVYFFVTLIAVYRFVDDISYYVIYHPFIFAVILANFSQRGYVVGEDDGFVTVCITLNPAPVMDATITLFTVANSGNAIGLSNLLERADCAC